MFLISPDGLRSVFLLLHLVLPEAVHMWEIQDGTLEGMVGGRAQPERLDV